MNAESVIGVGPGQLLEFLNLYQKKEAVLELRKAFGVVKKQFLFPLDYPFAQEYFLIAVSLRGQVNLSS